MTADPHSFIHSSGRGTFGLAHYGACLTRDPWVYERVTRLYVNCALNSSTLPWEARELTRPVLDVSMRRGLPRRRTRARPSDLTRVTLGTEPRVLSSQRTLPVGLDQSRQSADRAIAPVLTQTWPCFVGVFVTRYYYYSISIHKAEEQPDETHDHEIRVPPWTGTNPVDRREAELDAHPGERSPRRSQERQG